MYAKVIRQYLLLFLMVVGWTVSTYADTVSLFGLNFRTQNNVATIENVNNELKITGPQPASSDEQVEQLEVNVSAKEFNVRMRFAPDSEEGDWPNAIDLKMGIPRSDNSYQDMGISIMRDAINCWLELGDNRQNYSFNMDNFDITSSHTYGMKITNSDTIEFSIDGSLIFTAEPPTDEDIVEVNNNIRFQGKGVAYIENVTYADTLEQQNGDGDNNHDNDSKITGHITIPTDMGSLTSNDNCFDDNGQILPTCKAIFIDLRSLNDDWLGSTMVQSDGSYTLYFNKLGANETLNANMKFSIHRADGIEESFYRDFGTDNAVGGSGDASDSFKDTHNVMYIDDGPDINHLIISADETNINFDLSTIHANDLILEGTIVVPNDFTPGCIEDGANIQQCSRVSLKAINKATGTEYRTDTSEVETSSGSHTYPFRFYLPSGDYIIEIEENSDNNPRVEMYLHDDGDHAFGDSDTLISTTGVQWISLDIDDIHIPDSATTGYFTVNGNVNNIAIDISNFGADFKKIEGRVTPPSGYDLNNHKNHMNVELIDAKTGNWLSQTPVESDGSYSILLGNTVNPEGYIIEIHQDYWDEDNPENSWWRTLYFDLGDDNAVGGTGNNADTIKGEMDVRWEESEDSTEDEMYWVPNVKPLVITDTTTVNIDLSSYVPPASYKISGKINGIPAGAQWVDIHLYNPITFAGKGERVNADGSFEIRDVVAGKYILQLNYTLDDKDYQYIVVDNDGDFSLGADAIDSMDIMYVAYDRDGNLIDMDSLTNDSDWDSIAYWAPEETSTRKVILNVGSDITVSEFTIVPPTLYDLTVNLTNVGSQKRVEMNLFVPNQPIGRWEDITSNASGVANITLSGVKPRDDYQLQVWIEGLGEYWYDKTSNTLVSDVYWVGKQDIDNDGQVETCDDWQNNIETCDWDEPIEWEPNIDSFAINADKTLNFAIPNDKAKIMATLDLSTLNLNDGEYIYVNIWEENGHGYAWEEYSVSNNEVDISMAVKFGTNYKYRMEIWIPSTDEGYAVDIGNAVGGNDDKLITQENSWKRDGWGPKDSTLIPVTNASDVVLSGTSSGKLTPPALNTLTFTINNLDKDSANNISEQIFIDLEGLDGSNESTFEWYGRDNADWSDWRNPTYSATITVKVPNGNYRVMIHPQNHRGGLINNDNDTANEILTGEVTNFSWDWDKADKISVSGNQAYTITLPNSANMKSISGTVNLGDGDIEAGWIQAWSDTLNSGNGVEVMSDGTFEIRGLDAGTYMLEYWAWNNEGDFIRVADVNINDNVTGYTIQKSTTVHTFTGTVTNNNAGDSDISVLLLDVTDEDSSWEVIEDIDAGTLINGDTYNYTFNVPSPLTGHTYAIAVGVKVVETTGATTFTRYEATKDNNEEISLSDIDNDTNSVSITVAESIQ